MRRAVARYRQFLYLKVLFRKDFIVPPYDLDLLWHMHMVRFEYHSAQSNVCAVPLQFGPARCPVTQRCSTFPSRFDYRSIRRPASCYLYCPMTDGSSLNTAGLMTRERPAVTHDRR